MLFLNFVIALRVTIVAKAEKPRFFRGFGEHILDVVFVFHAVVFEPEKREKVDEPARERVHDFRHALHIFPHFGFRNRLVAHVESKKSGVTTEVFHGIFNRPRKLLFSARAVIIPMRSVIAHYNLYSAFLRLVESVENVLLVLGFFVFAAHRDRHAELLPIRDGRLYFQHAGMGVIPKSDGINALFFVHNRYFLLKANLRAIALSFFCRRCNFTLAFLFCQYSKPTLFC